MIAEALAPEEELRLLTPLASEAIPMAARSSLLEYVYATFPGEYDAADHHLLIIDALEKVERGEIKRLQINMPPRRGKSELATVRFPAWYLGRNQDREIISCSNTSAEANKNSRKVRRQITGPEWPFPGVELEPDEQAVGEWSLAGRRGRYKAAGVGGQIVGSGADGLIIDDPVKSREQAMSPVYRDKVDEWYENDAYTRLSPDGWVIIIATRWHEDDLCGRNAKKQADGGDEWTVLELREICEEGDDDPLGREPGAVLWPSRWPKEKTRTIRKTQPHVWWPQFQQRPSAATGGMYQRGWMNGRYDPDVLPEFEMVTMVCDSAYGEDMSADPTGIQVWGATQTHFYLLDDWNERVGYPSLIPALKAMYAKWHHLSPWVWIENKASGQSAIQSLRDESNIPVRKYDPKGSKESRGQDASRYYAAGRVLFPERRDWVHDVIAEMCGFPGAAHDERVDCAGMAIKALARAVGVSGDPIDEEDTGGIA